MTVHLINQRATLPNVAKLMIKDDIVIVTNDEIAEEVLAEFATHSITVALLEGTTVKPMKVSDTLVFKIISDNDWVRYTTSHESVISWG